MKAQNLKVFDRALKSIMEATSAVKMQKGKVHKIDCITALQSLKPGSVQCIFADPPFNLGKKYDTYKDKLPLKEYFEWTEMWIKESMKALADSGTLFIYNIPKMLTKTSASADKYGKFRHWISWNSPGRPLGKSLLPSHYGILYYTKKTTGFKFYDVRAPHKTCRVCKGYIKDYGGKKHLRHPFGYLVGDVWDDIHRNRHANKRIDNHPCQLPPHLIERLYLLSTDPGDLVVDLFAGGGSAGVAAKQLGRKYIGCDISQEYVTSANKIITETKIQKIGNVFVSRHLNKIVSVRNIDLQEGVQL